MTFLTSLFFILYKYFDLNVECNRGTHWDCSSLLSPCNDDCYICGSRESVASAAWRLTETAASEGLTCNIAKCYATKPVDIEGMKQPLNFISYINRSTNNSVTPLLHFIFNRYNDHGLNTIEYSNISEVNTQFYHFIYISLRAEPLLLFFYAVFGSWDHNFNTTSCFILILF